MDGKDPTRGLRQALENSPPTIGTNIQTSNPFAGDTNPFAADVHAEQSNPFAADVRPGPVLEFQDFSRTTTPAVASLAGTMSSAPDVKPTEAIAGVSYHESETLMSNQQAAADAKFYELNFYKPYFDVDSTMVLKRLLWSFWPFNTSFLNSIAQKPDLYGWFWVATTLIFLMAALSNFASWLTFTATEAIPTWQYDFTKVTFAAAAIYAYVGLMPLIIYLPLNHSDADVTFPQVACVYGYAMMAYIPAQVICLTPNEIVRWVVIAVGCLISGAFIAASLGKIVMNTLQKRGLIVFGILLVVHLGLAVTMKFFFFDFKDVVVETAVTAMS